MRRRKAREIALRVLFQVDVARADPDEAMSLLLSEHHVAPEIVSFAEEIVKGTLEHLEDIDKRLAELSRDWTLERMANTDRNILRMGCFELMYREDIPRSVAVNEAVELAKAYGGPDSGKFVNGILGRIVQDLDNSRGPGC
ncbi:MAG: transcription antitermination factor NusB [Firmicutes bacterium]|nr:transcription antitermination factor NusB [Bacillota bacterium]